jgi:excisionase family DNA binding protein
MFWTVKEAALFLDIVSNNVYYLINIGKIEAYKIGNIWRILPESVQEYKTKLS